MTGARLLAWAAAFAAAAALAASPRLDALVLSAAKGARHQSSFAPATPKIFLTGKVLDATQGTRVKGVWIAAKTAAAPPDYVIDSAEVTLGAGKNPRVDFMMTRPTAGWPVGDYRVDLLIDGRKAASVPFKVK